jgi:hypothetical protein
MTPEKRRIIKKSETNKASPSDFLFNNCRILPDTKEY